MILLLEAGSKRLTITQGPGDHCAQTCHLQQSSRDDQAQGLGSISSGRGDGPRSLAPALLPSKGGRIHQSPWYGTVDHNNFHQPTGRPSESFRPIASLRSSSRPDFGRFRLRNRTEDFVDAANTRGLPGPTVPADTEQERGDLRHLNHLHVPGLH